MNGFATAECEMTTDVDIAGDIRGQILKQRGGILRPDVDATYAEDFSFRTCLVKEETCKVAALLKERGIGMSEVDGIDENGISLCGEDAVHEMDVLPWSIRRTLNDQDASVLGLCVFGCVG